MMITQTISHFNTCGLFLIPHVAFCMLDAMHRVTHRLYILLHIRNRVFSILSAELHDRGTNIAPSESPAIFFACSGVEIPKPTAHGMSFAFFTSSTIAPISVVISLLVPVTPSEDTQYTKPDASFAIMLILSWEVGAMREIHVHVVLLAHNIELLFLLIRNIR